MTLRNSRRDFLKQAALATAPLWPISRLHADGKRAAANERITVAGIGIGPRGQLVLNAFLRQPDVQVVEICDVQEKRRSYARGLVNAHYRTRDCRMTRDFHETLAREDVDAVIIATGDNWHALASILAAKAGKDVYCEKPCGVTMNDAQELAEAIRTYGRVFQAGTQRRNVPNFRYAADLARGGRLGKLTTLHAAILNLGVSHDWLPAEPEPNPEEIDWDRWLGPAPWRPYNKQYLTGWRRYADFSSGANLLDWAAHTVDLCQWAADADSSGPVEFEPEGPTIHARYANGLKLVMRLAGFRNEGKWLGLGTCPVRFEGESGWVETGDSGKIEVSSPTLLEGASVPVEQGTNPERHIREFLDCMRTRKQPACNAEVVRRSHGACHAAAISWMLGRKLRYDPATESFPDDPEANRLRSRAKRSPWNA